MCHGLIPCKLLAFIQLPVRPLPWTRAFMVPDYKTFKLIDDSLSLLWLLEILGYTHKYKVHYRNNSGKKVFLKPKFWLQYSLEPAESFLEKRSLAYYVSVNCFKSLSIKKVASHRFNEISASNLSDTLLHKIERPWNNYWYMMCRWPLHCKTSWYFHSILLRNSLCE